VARRAQVTDRSPAAGLAAVALELDSEAAAVLRLTRAYEACKSQIERLRSTLAEAQAVGSALCLVMGDIDNFRKVYDAFGPRIGDEILKIFASVLAEAMRMPAASPVTAARNSPSSCRAPSARTPKS
jgi:GGDEF domain-containing protein